MDTASPARRPAPGRPDPASAVPQDRPAPCGGRVDGRTTSPWRWLPAALAVAFTAVVLHRYGVSAADTAVFAAYVVAGLAVPGTLVIRALFAGTRTRAEEIALGVTLGYAVEIFTYLAARALGAPMLVALWPAVTCALFLTVPRLRRHWRGGPALRTPPWWSWGAALAVMFLVAWGAVRFFGTHALTWPALGAAAPDMPFHLALVGELRHHVPPTVPAVAGEPLLYHWFVYAHLAAASWTTGIEPLVLLFRLGMLPMLAALVVLVGMTGRRLTGSWAGAAIAVTGTVLAGAPSLYLGTNGVFTWGGIPDTAWTSPTQTLGALLFAPVVLLVVDLFGRRRRRPGNLLLLAVFLLAVTGAKATYLPLLGAGLAAVAAVELVRRRGPSRPTLIALGMTALCLLFAQFVLFGRAQQGLLADPLSFVRILWRELTGAADGAEPATSALLGLASVCLLCWLVAWSGILGLLARPRLLARPGTVLALGMGAAGLGAVLLLGHPGRSQLFFLWGAYPYLATAAACGILALLRRAGTTRRAAAGAAGAGLAAAYLIPVLCGVRIPLAPGQDGALLYRPYLVLLAVTAGAGAVLAVRLRPLLAAALV
ncbi:hypothetical protein, partial [Streptosporangium fragile]|uniref:hypothetical protein n=1 Tax=Streptosporangium fragile TaxID=46186 RepID=UPI0031F08994